MAGARGLEAAPVTNDRDLIRRLFAEPQSFDFFQAVRLLEQLHPDRAPVGEFADPADEVLRFDSTVGVGFPPSAIQSLEESEDQGPAHMTVNFLGLTGPQGVLPLDYSLYAGQRVRAGDRALKDFLALFEHRIISLFYRAWAKSRAAIGFERAHDPDLPSDEHHHTDWMTRHLLDLAGLGSPAVQNRLPFPDSTLLHYIGLLALPSRPATALEQLVADYFDVPVEVEQFVGAWYPLDEQAQSALGDEAVLLGGGAVAGDEVWDQQSRVRVRIGPLARARYDEFLPGGAAHDTLRALTRFFGNDQFDFEIQLVLAREDAPPFQLDGDAPLPLGWCTWLRTEPLDRDPDDALFTL
jgi:type VI secretion system protein ImpH